MDQGQIDDERTDIDRRLAWLEDRLRAGTVRARPSDIDSPETTDPVKADVLLRLAWLEARVRVRRQSP